MDQNIFSVPNNARTIDDFKARLIQGGARPNLFEVEMAFPTCLLYTSPSPRDRSLSRMPSSA